MKPYNIIVILGHTASGKTRLAAHVASLLNTEIISADSRQVFRDMNTGTGKDLEEYVVDGIKIPYHLIDIKDVGTDYNLNDYINDFNTAYKSIVAKNKIPVLCGGSALYIHAVLKEYEYPEVPVDNMLRKKLQAKRVDQLQEIFYNLPRTPYHDIADMSTTKRSVRAIEIAAWLHENNYNPADKVPSLKPLAFGLAAERSSRRKRIEERLKLRLKNGLIEEVKMLMDKGIPAQKLIFYGLEYKFAVMYLLGEINYKYFLAHLTTGIHQFAKRQMTWFRKMEREGLRINWIDADLSLEDQMQIVKSHL